MNMIRERRRCHFRFLFFLLVSILLHVKTISAFLPSTTTTHHHRPRSLLFAATSSKTGGRLLRSSLEYETAIAQDRPVLVFWTAPWCGPCRLSVPVVKDVTKQFAAQLEACEICTDDLPECASDAGVVSIPTIHLYYKGELKDTLVGCVAKQVLAGSVEKVLEDIAALVEKKKT